MAKRVIWLIGDWKRDEFRPVAGWLRAQAACRTFATLAAATAAIDEASRPDAVILAQSRPGAIDAAEALQLPSALTATKVILLNGSWCEGEHRPVRGLTAMARVPWRRWREGLEAELARDNLPLLGTNGQDEKAIAAAELERGLARLARRQLQRRAAVWTDSHSTFGFVADALASVGVRAEWLGGSGCNTTAADVLVYDGWRYVLPIPAGRLPNAGRGTPRRAFPTGSTPRTVRTTGQVPRILLKHYPRPDDALAADAFGIDAILPQPFLLTDLASTLDWLSNRK